MREILLVEEQFMFLERRGLLAFSLAALALGDTEIEVLVTRFANVELINTFPCLDGTAVNNLRFTSLFFLIFHF